MRNWIAIFRIPLLLGVLGGLVAWSMLTPDQSEWFSNNMRRELVSPFATLAGFLMSITTFVVIKMKESVYDSDWYGERFRERMSVSSPDQVKAHGGLYGPLRRLCALLLLTVACCLLTSIANATIGIVASPMATAICIGMAVGSLAGLTASLSVAYENVTGWLNESQQLKDAEHEKRVKALSAALPTPESNTIELPRQR